MNDIFNKVFRAIFPHQNSASVRKEYGLPENIDFKFRVTNDGHFVVTIANMPGLVTEASTHQGLVEMINDAVLTYYDVPRRKADIVYEQFDFGGKIVQYEGSLQARSA